MSSGKAFTVLKRGWAWLPILGLARSDGDSPRHGCADGVLRSRVADSDW